MAKLTSIRRMSWSHVRSIGADRNQYWFFLPLTLMVWGSYRGLEAFAMKLNTHLVQESEELRVEGSSSGCRPRCGLMPLR